VGIHVCKRVSELGESLILAPERFDPRRRVGVESQSCLADLVDVVAQNVSAHSFDPGRPVLVLDTTHAYEGFVVLRHDPVAPDGMGSTKRRLEPGDVIISRLRPYLRQVAYVDADLFTLVPGGNEVVASTEFYVIRGREGFDVACLVPFLLSERVQSALAAGQEGGHHPRFSKELLRSLPVPECAVETPAITADRVRALAAAVRQSLAGCRSLVATVERCMSRE
jgi:hypothetical protein